MTSLRPKIQIEDRYELGQRILGLGLGEVWHVQRVADKQWFCAEFLRSRPGYEREFQRYRTTLQNTTLPNAARVMDGGAWEGHLYVVTEDPPGRPLALWLEERAKTGPLLPLGLVERIMTPLFQCLHHAHREGITHGSLTPASIVLHHDEAHLQVTVLDFGIGQFVDWSGQGRDMTQRVARYQPPEQSNARFGKSAPSDVFALGVILLELLTGRSAPEHPTATRWAELTATDFDSGLLTERVSVARPDLDRDFIASALKALAPNGQRYRTIDAMREGILDAMKRAPKSPALAGSPDSLEQIPHGPPSLRGPITGTHKIPDASASAGAPVNGPLYELPPLHIPGAMSGADAPGTSLSNLPPSAASSSIPPPAPPVEPPLLRPPTYPGALAAPRWEHNQVVDNTWLLLEREKRGSIPTGAWVARHLRTEARAVLRPFPSDQRNSDNARRSFDEESKIPGRFSPGVQPHIRRVFDRVDVSAMQSPYLVLEALYGPTLDVFVEQHKRLSVGLALRLLRQLATVLTEAQGMALTHGRLDPRALAVERTGGHPWIKVLDFGVVDDLSQTVPVNVPPLAAPEQWTLGGVRTPATDVWAFGLLAFYLLVGQHYFRSFKVGEAHDAVPRFLAENPPSCRATACGWEMQSSDEFDAWFAQCVALDPRRRFASAETAYETLDRVLRRGGVSDGEDDGAVPEPDFAESACVRIEAHRETLRTLSVHPDGRSFATGGIDRRIRCWLPGGSSPAEVLSAHEETVRALAWCGPTWLVSCGGDRALRFWTPGFGRHDPECQVIEERTPFLNALAGTVDETGRPVFFTGGMDYVIRGYLGVGSGRWETTQIDRLASPVRALAVSRNARRVLAASDRQEMTLYELDAARQRVGYKTLQGHTEGVSAVALAEHGRQGLSGGRDRTVRLWVLHDTPTLQPLVTLEGHLDVVSAVAFLPDGYLASGSHDGTVRVWDPKSAACVEVFSVGRSAVWCLGVLDGGRALVSGGSDGHVRIWPRSRFAVQTGSQVLVQTRRVQEV